MTDEACAEIERIRRLKARYLQYLDQKRWEEWADVFCEDVRVDTTQDGGPLLQGRQAFVDFLPPYLAQVRTSHQGHSPIIELTGPGRARGSWAMEDHLWFPPGSPRRHLWGVGWYFEQYRKDEDGEWRILELVLKRIRVEVDGVEILAPDLPAFPTD